MQYVLTELHCGGTLYCSYFATITKDYMLVDDILHLVPQLILSIELDTSSTVCEPNHNYYVYNKFSKHQMMVLLRLPTIT